MLTPDRIRTRLVTEFLSAPILENALRGYLCEAMLAEQLGPLCRITSHGWAPWDLEIGPRTGTCPDRIRIQVKNSARLQTWHAEGHPASDSLFNLTWRHRPSYWMRDAADVPCEEEGFLCDLFALCHHPVEDRTLADQTDPAQWQVYLLAADPACGHVTTGEIAACRATLARTGRPSSAQRRPATLAQGIRGRRDARPIPLVSLTLADVAKALVPRQ